MSAHSKLRRAASAAIAVVVAALAGCSSGDSESAPPPPLEARLSASRFLTQASFGPGLAEIDAVASTSPSAWFLAELGKPPTTYTNQLLAYGDLNPQVDPEIVRDVYWNAMVGANDQLRQRMVFALSQILVVSTADTGLPRQPITVAAYMDVLSKGAFGNYRDLLDDVTHSLAMGTYLTYFRNLPADMATGRVPDENYAREIMQLFTIGLFELNMDGTPRLQGGAPIETYTNADITGLAKVFTGFSYGGGSYGGINSPSIWRIPMEVYDQYHSTEEKRFLGTTIRANTGGDESVDMALDALFNHPNVAPFVCRQLIQRFVTSHPTPDYVRRVAMTFEAGSYTLPNGRAVGTGRRGDLSATLAAILFDDEARSASAAAADDFGKIREPIVRFAHWARAFDASPVNASNEILLEDTQDPNFLGQQAFRAPHVFNFYRPGYVAPGTATGAANLTAPELQIVNETTIPAYVNFMSRYIRDEAPKSMNASLRSFSPDYAAELALANDPAALVDRLDLILTYGRLRDDTKQRIIDVLAEVPIASTTAAADREQRVHLAVLMVTTSPEYIVQR